MRFNPDTVPSTITEAVSLLVETLTQRDLEFIDSIDYVTILDSVVEQASTAWSIDADDSPLRMNAREHGSVSAYTTVEMILCQLWSQARGRYCKDGQCHVLPSSDDHL